MLPYPSGRCTWGTCSSTRSATSSRASAARNGMHVLHPQGFDSFGLPAENAAINGGWPPARDRRAEHRAHHALDAARRLGLRLVTRALDPRSRVLPLAAVAVPEVPRARARLPEGRAGQVVPQRPDRARERAGARRALRALRRRGRVARDGAVVLPDHRLRAGAARRPRDGRLAGVDQGTPAQLDRPLGGRRDPVPDRGAGRGRPVFTTRPDTLYGATFFVLAPEHEFVERIDSDEVREYVRRAGAKKTAERAAATEKTGVYTGLHAVNPVNGERLPVYVADYVLTDYGTGRSWPCPRTTSATSTSRRRSTFRSGRSCGLRERGRRGRGVRRAHRGRDPRQLGGVRRTCRRPRAVAGSSRSSPRRVAAASRSTTGCATGASRDSATGAARSRSSTASVRDRPGAGGRAAGRPPRDRGLQAEGRAAARAGRGVGERAVPALRRPGEARDRDDGHVRRLVLVLPALLRPCTTTRRRSTRAAVDYWNPVDLYIGGVDHATVHMIYARFWVKVLNDLGLVGLPRAVRAVLLQRLGDARQDEDVEAGRERRRAGRLRRALRRRRLPPEHPVPGAGERGHGVDRDERRGDGTLRPAALERRRRGRRDRAARASPGGPLARKAHATIAKVTDDIGRRYAFNTAIAAVMELVNELSKDRRGPTRASPPRRRCR